MSAVLLFLGLAILILLAGYTFAARGRQSRSLREFAARNRLNFTSEDLIDLHGRYYRLECVRRGHNHYAWNLLYGSCEEGLVSLFCHRCDLGFGVNQVSDLSWIAVVETSAERPGWSAERPRGGPAAPAQRGGVTGNFHEARVGPFLVRADAPETLVRLQRAGLDSFFADHPAIDRAEVRRQLAAVAAPYDRDPHTPARLLDAVRSLVRLADAPRT